MATSSEEVEALLKATGEAFTDQMFERLAITLERLGTLADVAGRPENLAALTSTVERLRVLEESGTLAALEHIARLVKATSEAFTDQMFERLAMLAEALGSIAATPGVPELLTAAAAAAPVAAEQAAKAEIRPGVMGLLSSLRDPETRRGLEFLLRFGKELQKNAGG